MPRPKSCARKPLVLQYCSSSQPLGGVWTYINVLAESRLTENFRFQLELYPGPTQGISPKSILRIRNTIARARPDLVHIHGLQTEGFHLALGAWAAAGGHVLLTAHGFIEDSCYRVPWRQRTIRVLEYATLGLVDKFYCVSAYGRGKSLVRRFATKSLGAVNNGLPMRVIGADRIMERQRYGLEDDDFVVVCVGRLSREKGLLLLPEVIQSARAHGAKNLRLLLVGDGPDRITVERAVRNFALQQYVTSTGAIRDPSGVYAAADAMLLPSLHEHQSFAVLEAMRASLAVAAFAVGGNPELVVHRETGILVSPGDAEKLGLALAELAKNRVRTAEMGRAGRERWARLFSVERMAIRVGAIYDAMLGSSGTARAAV